MTDGLHFMLIVGILKEKDIPDAIILAVPKYVFGGSFVMVKTLINFFRGIDTKIDEASIREMNRMELEYVKVMVERELSLGVNRFIHRI